MDSGFVIFVVLAGKHIDVYANAEVASLAIQNAMNSARRKRKLPRVTDEEIMLVDTEHGVMYTDRFTGDYVHCAVKQVQI